MTNYLRILMVLTVATFFTHTVSADPAQSKEETRKYFVDDILTKRSPERIAGDRWDCADGDESSNIAEGNREGDNLPDTTDLCVAVLTRIGREGGLSNLYSLLLTKNGLPTDGFEKLPASIGAAVTNKSDRVSVGGGKALRILPGMAFDAGFTVAYQTGAPEQSAINEARLREVSEACLGKGGDLAACYAVGYVYGARVYKTDAGHN